MSDLLASRVDRLERQNRLLKFGMVFCALGLMTCGGGGITSNYERVNTRTLVIQDGQGNAEITVSGGAIRFHAPDGSVTLDAAAVTKLLAASP